MELISFFDLSLSVTSAKLASHFTKSDTAILLWLYRHWSQKMDPYNIPHFQFFTYVASSLTSLCICVHLSHDIHTWCILDDLCIPAQSFFAVDVMERDEKPADFLLPESVKTWFTNLYANFRSGNVPEMARLYDREFHNLTNNYFKQTAWPEPVAIESLVDHNATFLLFYKQIYFRHMFSKLQPNMKKKIESWNVRILK